MSRLATLVLVGRAASRPSSERARMAQRAHIVDIRVVGAGDGRRLWSPAAADEVDEAPAEEFVRHLIIVGHLAPPDFDPEIVTASCRDDREALAGKFVQARPVRIEWRRIRRARAAARPSAGAGPRSHSPRRASGHGSPARSDPPARRLTAFRRRASRALRRRPRHRLQ